MTDRMIPTARRGTECGGGQDRAAVGLIQVGAHTGYVTHIVTHVVRDGGGITGVVLGDTGLHLSYQVCAHVSGLGVDTAAHTRKESLCGGTHSEGQHGRGDDHQLLRAVRIDKCIQNDVPQRDIQQTETHYGKSHDGTRAEGQLKTGVQRAAGGIGRSSRSVCCGLHTYEAGESGKESSGEESERNPVVLHIEAIGQNGEEYGKNDEHYSHHLILLLEICHGPFADMGSYLSHGRSALVLLEHSSVKVESKSQCNEG